MNDPTIESHASVLSEARKSLHTEPVLRNLSDTFKMLGDPTRLKICLALTNRELCVGDIASLLDVTESAVSHQLRLLKTMRLVALRREGQQAFYKLDDDHIEQLISMGLGHVKETPQR